MEQDPQPWPSYSKLKSWTLVCKVGSCQAGTQTAAEEEGGLGNNRAGGRDKGSEEETWVMKATYKEPSAGPGVHSWSGSILSTAQQSPLGPELV